MIQNFIDSEFSRKNVYDIHMFKFASEGNRTFLKVYFKLSMGFHVEHVDQIIRMIKCIILVE